MSLIKGRGHSLRTYARLAKEPWSAQMVLIIAADAHNMVKVGPGLLAGLAFTAPGAAWEGNINLFDDDGETPVGDIDQFTQQIAVTAVNFTSANQHAYFPVGAGSVGVKFSRGLTMIADTAGIACIVYYK